MTCRSSRGEAQEPARQKLRALVDEAAGYALADNRKIRREELVRTLNGSGGKDWPKLEVLEWDEVVTEELVQQDMKSLIRLLEDPARTRSLSLEALYGLLLVGPSGTGKALIARLIASQTNRSFYSLIAANVLGGGVSDSVKRVVGVFSRAKENSPAIIFFGEMDGLLPTNNRYLSQHDIQTVEQFLREISSWEADNNVFLVGTTNDPDIIDPRVLRGVASPRRFRLVPGNDKPDTSAQEISEWHSSRSNSFRYRNYRVSRRSCPCGHPTRLHHCQTNGVQPFGSHRPTPAFESLRFRQGPRARTRWDSQSGRHRFPLEIFAATL